MIDILTSSVEIRGVNAVVNIFWIILIENFSLLIIILLVLANYQKSYWKIVSLTEICDFSTVSFAGMIRIQNLCTSIFFANFEGRQPVVN